MSVQEKEPPEQKVAEAARPDNWQSIGAVAMKLVKKAQSNA